MERRIYGESTCGMGNWHIHDVGLVGMRRGRFFGNEIDGRAQFCGALSGGFISARLGDATFADGNRLSGRKLRDDGASGGASGGTRGTASESAQE